MVYIRVPFEIETNICNQMTLTLTFDLLSKKRKIGYSLCAIEYRVFKLNMCLACVKTSLATQNVLHFVIYLDL